MLGELLEVQCHHQQQIDILKIPLFLKLLPLYQLGIAGEKKTSLQQLTSTGRMKPYPQQC